MAATVDGGAEARLGGSFGERRYAFILEVGIQEDCFYGTCLAYLIDLTKGDFSLLAPQKLESRSEVLKRKVCRGLSQEQCQAIATKHLMVEEKDETKLYEHLAMQYLDTQSAERRAVLGAWERAPVRLSLVPQETISSQLKLSAPELTQPTPFEWLVSLEERWTTASFRAYTESEVSCRPETNSDCKAELRWIDGIRSNRWVCAGPCQGLASMVRVAARPAHGSQGAIHVGRSNLVEPGAIASYGVGMASTRRVPLSSLALLPDAVRAYAFPNHVVLVGAFAEGAGGNGTWFPLVLHLPRSLSGGTPARSTVNHGQNNDPSASRPRSGAALPAAPATLPKQNQQAPTSQPSTSGACAFPAIFGNRSTTAWGILVTATVHLRSRRRRTRRTN